jgi:hypothetical protein
MNTFATFRFRLVSGAVLLSLGTVVAVATYPGFGSFREQRTAERSSPVEVRFATKHCYRHFNNQRDVQACLKSSLGF